MRIVVVILTNRSTAWVWKGDTVYFSYTYF